MGDQATHPYKKSKSLSRPPLILWCVQLVLTQREEMAKRSKEENTFSCIMNSLIYNNRSWFSWELHSLVYFNISKRITQLIITVPTHMSYMN